MKKIIFFIAIIGILIVIGISFLNNPERIFKTHVLPQVSETIENLKYYKDRCGMHGPFIFFFEANQEDIQKIIKVNGLVKSELIPEFTTMLLEHITNHNMPWLKSLEDFKQMEIYGKSDTSSHEPHLKFIFLDKGNRVYYLQI